MITAATATATAWRYDDDGNVDRKIVKLDKYFHQIVPYATVCPPECSFTLISTNQLRLGERERAGNPVAHLSTSMHQTSTFYKFESHCSVVWMWAAK